MHKMRHSLELFSLGLSGLLPLPLMAQTAPSTVTPALNSAGSVAQVMLGLAVVLALMFAVAWVMKRMGMARMNSSQTVRVIGGTSVGTRERVVVVEIGDQWIVVGVAPGRVNSLATLARQTNTSMTSVEQPQARSFASWLNAKKDGLQKNSGSHE